MSELFLSAEEEKQANDYLIKLKQVHEEKQLAYIVTRVPVEAQQQATAVAKKFAQDNNCIFSLNTCGIDKSKNGTPQYVIAIQHAVDMAYQMLHLLQMTMYNALCVVNNNNAIAKSYASVVKQNNNSRLYRHNELEFNVFVNGIVPNAKAMPECMQMEIEFKNLPGYSIQRLVSYVHECMCKDSYKMYRSRMSIHDYIKVWCCKLYVENSMMTLCVYTDFVLDVCDVGVTMLMDFKKVVSSLQRENVTIRDWRS